MSYSGQPLKRLEDPRLVTGNGSFVDDIRLSDMLYACVLRSPYAHARIRSIDVAAARLLPGVVAVLTGGDLAGVLRDLPTRAMDLKLIVQIISPVVGVGGLFFGL